MKDKSKKSTYSTTFGVDPNIAPTCIAFLPAIQENRRIFQHEKTAFIDKKGETPACAALPVWLHNLHTNEVGAPETTFVFRSKTA